MISYFPWVKLRVMFKLLLILTIFVASAGAHSQDTFEGKEDGINTIAILPILVIREDRRINKKDASLQRYRDEDRRDGIVMQRDLYRYFLRDLYKRKYPSEYVQDVNETNKILAKNGIEYKDIIRMRPSKLAKILQVDGVIVGEFDHRIPTKGLFTSISSGGWPGTNKIKSIFKLHSVDGKTVWGREIKASGADEEGNIYGLCKSIMRKIPPLFPYYRMQP